MKSGVILKKKKNLIVQFYQTSEQQPNNLTNFDFTQPIK